MQNLTLTETEYFFPRCTLPFNYFAKAEHTLQPQPNTWVQLLELPHPFAHEEALLLCQHSESEWVAWIPDFGEAILNTKQFCFS